LVAVRIATGRSRRGADPAVEAVTRFPGGCRAAFGSAGRRDRALGRGAISPQGNRSVGGSNGCPVKTPRRDTGRPIRRYIDRHGTERHYDLHVEIVEIAFGVGARFEDHAAVTELLLCASASSRPVDLTTSPCAKAFLE
jgi:hypothetical protein